MLLQNENWYCIVSLCLIYYSVHILAFTYLRALWLFFSGPWLVGEAFDQYFYERVCNPNFTCISTGSCHYVHSRKSFLFSLYNINGYAPVKVNIKSGHFNRAIYTCSSYGPTFGGGYDLYISNNAASNRNSYTYCGHSYHFPPGYSASGTSCRFYAGGSSIYLTPIDVEVFYQTTT